jgi:ABC-type Na+ efflux pump permease subunit
MHLGPEAHDQMSPEIMRKHYLVLALNLLISAVIMYFVMFTMIWTTRDFFNNLNTLYMALMMVTPMGILMLLMMGMMYPDRKMNLILYIGFAVIFALALIGMRVQSGIGDRQFLRSMIPHHSGAVLMCREAQVRDPEIKALCGRIIRSQTGEIEEMKRIMARL